MRTIIRGLMVSLLAGCSMFGGGDHGDNTVLDLPVANGQYIPAIAWQAENLPHTAEAAVEYLQTVKYYLRGFDTEAECSAATIPDIRQNQFLLYTQVTHTAQPVTHLDGDKEFENDPLIPGKYYRAVVTVQPNSQPTVVFLPLSSCKQAAN